MNLQTLAPGISPLLGCSDSNSLSYLSLSAGDIAQLVAAGGSCAMTGGCAGGTGEAVGLGGGALSGGGRSPTRGAGKSLACTLASERSRPACATATSLRATKKPALSRAPRPPGSDRSHTRDSTTSLRPDFFRKRAASSAPTLPTPPGSTYTHITFYTSSHSNCVMILWMKWARQFKT